MSTKIPSKRKQKKIADSPRPTRPSRRCPHAARKPKQQTVAELDAEELDRLVRINLSLRTPRDKAAAYTRHVRTKGEQKLLTELWWDEAHYARRYLSLVVLAPRSHVTLFVREKDGGWRLDETRSRPSGRRS